jgi:hypothetical protein
MLVAIALPFVEKSGCAAIQALMDDGKRLHEYLVFCDCDAEVEDIAARSA